MANVIFFYVQMLRLLVVAVVCVAALASPLVTPELDDQWESFKDLYNKQYGDEEHLMRYKYKSVVG